MDNKDAAGKKCSSINVLAALWVLLIGIASYLAPNVITFQAFEKHSTKQSVSISYGDIFYRQNLFIKSKNVTPFPFENVYLPIYSSHNIYGSYSSITTAIVPVHGYSRDAGCLLLAHIH